MRFEMGRVDHECVCPAALFGPFGQHPREDACLAPPLPAAVKPPVRPIGRRRISPAQPIAIDEYNPTQYPSIIPSRDIATQCPAGQWMGDQYL